ncbi:hopanoid-associated sugar epimerase [Teredinibacter turnerae]|uniref:hopanoid-associated sugar epimerase n=1 Tax=Teredinibacter turnerae TaxID=2426 RepID=UPI0030D46713
MINKALVTGASGFLGNAVARALLQQGTAVRVLCRHADNPNLEGMAVEQVIGDLTKPSTLAQAATGCDVLFHVAADYRLWVRDPAAMYAANVDGSLALMRAALACGVERVVYTSSVATLKASAQGQIHDESHRGELGDMVGHYKRSKFLAQQAIENLCAEGAPIVLVSPSAPVGPRDIKPTPTGKILVDAANGKMPAYLDTGLNIAHVDDVAQGHLLACEHGNAGENYILAGENLLLRDILAIIAKLTGRRAPRVELSPNWIKPLAVVNEAIARISGQPPMIPLDGVRMAEKKMFFSHTKAQAQLGYHPRPAIEAIADALVWFHQQGYIRRAPLDPAVFSSP